MIDEIKTYVQQLIDASDWRSSVKIIKDLKYPGSKNAFIAFCNRNNIVLPQAHLTFTLNKWTPERHDTLTFLCLEKKTARQITEIMQKDWPSLTIMMVRNRIAKTKLLLQNAKPQRANNFAGKTVITQSKLKLGQEFSKEAAGANAIELINATPQHCRWLHGRSTCCGNIVINDSSYCDKHYPIVYRKKENALQNR